MGLFLILILILILSFYHFSFFAFFNGGTCETLNKDTMNLDQVFEKMTYYYLNKDSNLTIQLINGLIKEEVFKEGSSTKMLSIVFLSEVFSQNPFEIEKWITTDLCLLRGLDKDSYNALTVALWMSNTEESKNVLKQLPKTSKVIENYINELLSTEPLDIKKIEIDSGEKLDMLWAAFFATGEEIYIQRIISVLPDYYKYREMAERRLKSVEEGNKTEMSDEENEKFMKYVVGKVAKWSLTQNAVHHEKVYEILENQYLEVPGIENPLDEIMSEAYFIQMSEKREFDLLNEATDAKDDILCEKLMDVFLKDYCIQNIAARTNNFFLCKKINYSELINACYWGIALQTNNLSLCNELPLKSKSSGIYNKDVCIAVASITDGVRMDGERWDGRFDGTFGIIYETTDKQDEKLNEFIKELTGN